MQGGFSIPFTVLWVSSTQACHVAFCKSLWWLKTSIFVHEMNGKECEKVEWKTFITFLLFRGIKFSGCLSTLANLSLAGDGGEVLEWMVALEVKMKQFCI